MGAAYIQVAGYGKTADEVYRSLVEDDKYENGHKYNTGTIGASHGFTMVPLDQKKFTKAALSRWLDNAMEEADKWGPLHCLELPRSYAKGCRRGVRKFVFAGWVPD